MKKFVVGAVLSLGFAGAVQAQEESETAQVGHQKADTFQYGWSKESTEDANGDASTETWGSARSGHLTGGINSELNKYRLRLNANGGELLGVQETEIGKNFLNKFQVEAGAATGKAAYGMLALELPVVKPVTFFMGSVHNPGGAQRFVLGPVAYYGQSTSLLFWYPRGSKSESPVDHALVLRNRIREFDSFWIDADLTYKSVSEEDAVDDFSPYGYSAALGIWKVYGKYSVTPYLDGQLVTKTSYEVGVDASF